MLMTIYTFLLHRIQDWARLAPPVGCDLFSHDTRKLFLLLLLLHAIHRRLERSRRPVSSPTLLPLNDSFIKSILHEHFYFCYIHSFSRHAPKLTGSAHNAENSPFRQVWRDTGVAEYTLGSCYLLASSFSLIPLELVFVTRLSRVFCYLASGFFTEEKKTHTLLVGSLFCLFPPIYGSFLVLGVHLFCVGFKGLGVIVCFIGALNRKHHLNEKKKKKRSRLARKQKFYSV